MNFGKSIFAQLMDQFSRYHFQTCVERYHGNAYIKRFSCWEQFLCLAFAQLTYRESLRDIEACLAAQHGKLYHLGFRNRPTRSTLAEANEKRDWRIYADFAQILIQEALLLYGNEGFATDLRQTAYALDASTIDLCLSLFPWAPFRRHKAAIKLHTLLDVSNSIPVFIDITHGKIHDVNILDRIVPQQGAIYIMDRGYLDFARLFRLHQALAFFVIRAKHNLRYRRTVSRAVDKSIGLQCDQTIHLTGSRSAQQYPLPLRRVRYLDTEHDHRLVFLTNHFGVTAKLVADLYRERWKVELFFKWIKQHLRIKKFYGNSLNAVKTQIWIAVSIYVLVAIIKKRLRLPHSLYTILQILSITVFEKTPILRAFSEAHDEIHNDHHSNQLRLFEI